MIEEVRLSVDLSIPQINGLFFCSRRDPVREAVQWTNVHREAIEQSEKITVVGLGAGFHLHFIPRDKEVCFIEREASLIERFQKLYPDSQARPLESLEFFEGSMVLLFRPALSLHEEFYRELMATPQLNIKLIEGLFPLSAVNEEQKTWKTLKELVV
jgi:hypothetical protein